MEEPTHQRNMARVPVNITKPCPFSHVHSNHFLTFHSDDRHYTCHGCKTSDTGARFRCHTCDVDVHVYCSDFPQELSSFLHSHRLALVLRMNRRRCDVCLESIGGMFYRCNQYDFDVHPLCTKLPEQLRHVIDYHHKLRLYKPKLSSASDRCSVCNTDCSSHWVYRCDVCRVNIHPKCVLKPYGTPSVSRHTPYPYAPPWTTAQQPHYHGAFSGGAYPHGPYVNPNGLGGYVGHSSYGHASAPSVFPYYQGNYALQPNNYGYVQFPPNAPSTPWPNYRHTPPSPPPSILGSIFGATMCAAIVENLAAGAVADFIFGSVGF